MRTLWPWSSASNKVSAGATGRPKGSVREDRHRELATFRLSASEGPFEQRGVGAARFLRGATGLQKLLPGHQFKPLNKLCLSRVRMSESSLVLALRRVIPEFQRLPPSGRPPRLAGPPSRRSRSGHAWSWVNIYKRVSWQMLDCNKHLDLSLGGTVRKAHAVDFNHRASVFQLRLRLRC